MMDGVADVAANPTEVYVQRVDRIAEFPARGTSSQHYFVGDGIKLRPISCSLADAGCRPSKLGAKACGAWRGSIAAPDAVSAASRLASLLSGSVLLDGCGILASSDLPAATLRFLKTASGEDEEASSQAENILGGSATAMRLSGQLGRILSHTVDLWLRMTTRLHCLEEGGSRDSAGDFDALLILTPAHRCRWAGRPSFQIAQQSPMGVLRHTWEEIALIELPRLMRLTIDGCVDRKAAALAKEPRYLVDEEEEFLRIQCWRRLPGTEGVNGDVSRAAGDAISMEQLLWYTSLSGLADTPPCAEAAVPSERVEITDEGRATKEEILGEVVQSDVAKEDAPRMASIAFLRQYMSQEAIVEELLPRLLPQSGTIRVFSGQLMTNASLPQVVPGRQNRVKTLDDLFSDDMDIGSLMPSRPNVEDPLANYELTSVFLINEPGGFLVAFHCVQGIDPLASS